MCVGFAAEELRDTGSSLMVEGLLRATTFETFDNAVTGAGSEFVIRCRHCEVVKGVIMGGREASCRASSDVMFVVCVLVM